MAIELHKPPVQGDLPYALFDRHWLELTGRDEDELELTFSDSVWSEDLFLVVDIYSAANPVHPQGHVGWWKCPLDDSGDITVSFVRGPRGLQIRFNGASPEELWVNPAFTGAHEPVLAVHVVLRNVTTEAIQFEDTIHLYQDAAALETSIRRQTELAGPGSAPSTPWYVWPREVAVHVVATNIYERDAVGNFAIGVRQLLAANGIKCQLYASQFDPGLRGLIRHTCNVITSAADDDIVLVHLSIVDPWLPEISQLAARKLLYFHNITPPRFFQVYDAEYAAHCSKGVEQIVHAQKFDVLLANSQNSATVLRNLMKPKTQLACDQPGAEINANGHVSDAPLKGPFEDASRLLERAARMLDKPTQAEATVHVCPPWIPQNNSQERKWSPIELPGEKTRLLYVGRIAPHKRIEDLLALFAQYQRLDTNSALLLVGGASFSGYMGYLRYLVEHEYSALQPCIHFLNSISPEQLETVYRSASALISMSEHEGFCLPVVEAMAHDVPVFAYADPAVRETLGKTGRVFFQKEYVAIAKDLHDLLSQTWKRTQVINDQRRRLAEITEAAKGHVLWSAFEEGLRTGARTI